MCALSTRDRCYSYRCHQLPWLLEMTTATGHAVYQIECCIRGYHVYHRIWHPIIGEVLGTTSERENEHDSHAVAVRNFLCGQTLASSNKPRVLLLFENRRDDHWSISMTSIAYLSWSAWTSLGTLLGRFSPCCPTYW